MPRPYYEDDYVTCSSCNGSGEGRWTGVCTRCNGNGEVLNEKAQDDYDDAEADRKYDEWKDRQLDDKINGR